MRHLRFAFALVLTLLASQPASAGTWGTGTFDGDHASDYLLDVARQDSIDPLREAIARAAAPGSYLEAPDAEEALAAMEFVAAARGTPTAAGRAEERVTTWVARTHPAIPADLVDSALRGIDAILGDASELHELWAESDDYEAWRAGVLELKAQLQSPTVAPQG